ncbi:winged helix-turn-helix domain-containing protein [Sandaracinus amylolyticus]|uniref:winged helix-turn-helix domain-containing protein n=1 Tax=Sandaracinus amylolyticus TaxID=927083 RepID=UPI001F2F13BC|nr:winged helix-turn-helix domain-containing protein [Sandaracinus amylolyticus]UJR84076.1 Hypothetical protein I5071_61470 [Sandaracinus amylolyticus]
MKHAAAAAFVGRADELAWLERALLDDETPVVFVHGIAGIGKSALLHALSARLAARGAEIIELDGREIEPIERGFLGALAIDADLDGVMRTLDARDSIVVLLVDERDALRLLEGWLRRRFVPAMPARVRLVLAGRSAPSSAWTAAPGWDAIVRTLHVGPLGSADADALLARDSLAPATRARLGALANGHPLALKLASAAIAARPDLPLDEIESRHVVAELTRRFLADVDDPIARAAVEAASVLRRVTRPLLAQMLGEEHADTAVSALRALPFVESGPDGLVLHQTVRSAVERSMRALDPARHLELRKRAWAHLRAEIHAAPRARSWRLTADTLYLVERPEIREAFFPTDEHALTMDAALLSDHDAIVAIARAHLRDDEVAMLDAWWARVPDAFHVARDEEGRIVGFYVLAFAERVDPALSQLDPVLARWLAHLREAPIPAGRPALFNRVMVDAQRGEAPSSSRAAYWLDAKRTYVERLDLARIYVAAHSLDVLPVLSKLDFRYLAGLTVPLERAHVHTFTLDFGEGVLAWLSRLVDAQYEQPAPRFVIDRDACELVVDGSRARLTRLELGVLRYLEDRGSAVVSRQELIEGVWGQAYSGSNVVDAVIRTLRKKLGPHADAIETVTGFGYRLRGR